MMPPLEAALPGLAADRLRVARRFGSSAGYYEARAEVQRRAARRVVRILSALEGLPPGPVLEVGCGTGFISRELPDLFPRRRLELTDLSEGMLRACRSSLTGAAAERVEMRAADGEQWSGEGYGVIVAGLVAQWFSDPVGGLVRLAGALAPGGALVASLPTAASFPEWRRACFEAGVAHTGRALPEAEEVVWALSAGELAVAWSEQSLTEEHESPLHFFRHLRRMGAQGGAGKGPLSPTEFRSLLRSWEALAGDRTEVTYRILFLTLRRPLLDPTLRRPPRDPRAQGGPLDR